MFKLFINGILRVFLDYARFNGYTLWVYKPLVFTGGFFVCIHTFAHFYTHIKVGFKFFFLVSFKILVF